MDNSPSSQLAKVAEVNSICQELSSFFPPLSQVNGCPERFIDQVFQPAIDFAGKLKSSSTTYQFEPWVENSYLKPCSITHLDIKECILIDVTSRKTLTPNQLVTADSHGIIGWRILQIAPALWRRDPNKLPVRLTREMVLAKLLYPLAARSGQNKNELGLKTPNNASSEPFLQASIKSHSTSKPASLVEGETKEKPPIAARTRNTTSPENEKIAPKVSKHMSASLDAVQKQGIPARNVDDIGHLAKKRIRTPQPKARASNASLRNRQSTGNITMSSPSSLTRSKEPDVENHSIKLEEREPKVKSESLDGIISDGSNDLLMLECRRSTRIQQRDGQRAAREGPQRGDDRKMIIDLTSKVGGKGRSTRRIVPPAKELDKSVEQAFSFTHFMDNGLWRAHNGDDF